MSNDMNTNNAPADITDRQIRNLREEATLAGDMDQVLLCFVALGFPIVDVIATLPDGQEFHDDAHCSGQRTYVDIDAADRRCNWLAENRPEGHDAVTYTSRVRATVTRDEARLACARVIADAQAHVRVGDEWERVDDDREVITR